MSIECRVAALEGATRTGSADPLRTDHPPEKLMPPTLVSQRREGNHPLVWWAMKKIDAMDQRELSSLPRCEFIGHSDQVGKRCSFHLLHHATAMNFHRDFA